MTKISRFSLDSIINNITEGGGFLFALDDLHFLHGIDVVEALGEVTALMSEFKDSQPRKKRHNIDSAFRCIRNSVPFGRYEREALSDFEEFIVNKYGNGATK